MPPTSLISHKHTRAAITDWVTYWSVRVNSPQYTWVNLLDFNGMPSGVYNVYWYDWYNPGYWGFCTVFWLPNRAFWLANQNGLSYSSRVSGTQLQVYNGDPAFGFSLNWNYSYMPL